MKKIVLKMSELNLRNERYGKLEYASLHVMEGDITSFLGLNYSGKELAVQILLGEIDLDWNKNKVYIDGQKIQRASDLHPLVYHLCADSPGIENWTVAEYISLTEVNWFLSKKVKKRLLKVTEQQLEEVGIHIDIQKKMNSLNVLERRMVEVMRARKKGARILILEDECEGMDREMLCSYEQFLKKVIKNHMAAILICHSDMATSVLADNYIIFRRGRIVKKWKKNSAYNNGEISDYLLGGTMIQKKNSLDSYARKIRPGKDIVYSVRNLAIGKTIEDYDFRKGEISTFVLVNHTERMKLFMNLSGRITPDSMQYLLNGKFVSRPAYLSFIKNKVVSVMKSGNDYEIFEKMSVGDNLILPSLRKIPRLVYMVSGDKMSEILSEEMEHESLINNDIVYHLDKNNHINISFNRWYVFNPKAIILYEPFTSCDAYGVSIILSYIKKMADRGTAVIVIKSNIEYMHGISDRVFIIE